MDDGHISTGLIVLFLIGSLWMLWPFLGALLFGMLTAYILINLEEELYDHLNNRIASNLIVILLLSTLIASLLYGITSSVSALTSNIEAFLTTISGSASFIITIFDLPSSLASVIDSLVTDISSILRSTLLNELGRFPQLIVDVTIYVMAVYYFYRHGKTLRSKIYEHIHQLDGQTGQIATRMVRSLDDIARSVFLNRLLLALTATLLTGIGFFLMGIDFWWGWALLTGIFSFLPFFHEALVYLPVGGLYTTLGNFWLGVVIIVYGLLVINTLPALFIRPHLDTHILQGPKTLLFLGFIAGPTVLGAKGIILGPVILILTRDFFDDIFGLTEEPS